MMTMSGLEALATAILAANDVDEETAAWCADLIGDTPEIDGEGLFMVRDFNTGVIVARLSIPGW
jgi:LDH2 family malate/lactate/ureidoglycolate dehydrogenase